MLDSIERIVPGLNALAVLSSKRRVRALRRHPPPHGRRCIEAVGVHLVTTEVDVAVRESP